MRRARASLAAFSLAACTIWLSGCGALDFNDIDRLSCNRPSIVAPPIASMSFDGLSNEQLEHESASRDRKGRAAARAMGERYEQGRGVAPDLKKAVAWYRAAALVLPEVKYVYMPGFKDVPGSVIGVGAGGPVAPGDPIALRRLGEIYRSGTAVMADSGRAQALLECAANYGVSDDLHIVRGNRVTI